MSLTRTIDVLKYYGLTGYKEARYMSVLQTRAAVRVTRGEDRGARGVREVHPAKISILKGRLLENMAAILGGEAWPASEEGMLKLHREI